jgi:hypothetical protein
MTTPSKAFVFGLLGCCAAAEFATCARFEVSTSMDSKLSNPSVSPRKAKSRSIYSILQPQPAGWVQIFGANMAEFPIAYDPDTRTLA